MTLIGIIWKAILGLTAVSLVLYAVTPNATLGYLAKLFALNWGIALGIFIVWPHVRGVRKGDPIFVSEESTLPLLFALPNAVAKDNGRLNGFISVEFGDGTTGIGKVVKYQGLITHAEVKLLEKEVQMKAANGTVIM